MATLGEKLRAGRERRGATTSQAAASTRIMVQHIEAMEANQFQRIPAPTYAKGFIRMYAEYGGLDPAPLVREYVEQYMPKVKPRITPPEPPPRKDAPVAARTTPAARPASEAAARPASEAVMDFGKAWRAFMAALRQAWSGFRPALDRVPWRLVAALAVLAVSALAVGRAISHRARVPQGPVVVDAADSVAIPDDVPAVIRDPPEPYLEARPPGRRAP